jgi:hypothetical protein
LVIGHESNQYQICASKPVLTLDQFGMWSHVAVVLDGTAKRVVHYVNGVQVGEKALKIKPPFRIGTAELGNWNARGFPKEDPFMIRNFSGAMDEFCLFSRAKGTAAAKHFDPQTGASNQVTLKRFYQYFRLCHEIDNGFSRLT